jgi:hypothetical protein
MLELNVSRMPPRRVNRPAPVVKQERAAAPRWLRPAVLALSAFLLMGWFSAEVNDTDTWWHLKTGQYIWQNHALPVPDPFAYTTYLGKPAYPGEGATRDFNLAHEWLAQIILYLVYAAGGFPGLVLFRAALMTAFSGVLGLVAFHRSHGFYRSLAAAFAAAIIAKSVATDRPYLITFLLLAITLAILEYRGAARWARLWVLPGMFLVWANLHGGYFMGWAVVGAYCAEALFLRWRKQPVPDERRLWTVFALSVLASGLNPNFFAVIPGMFAYRQSFLQSTLNEWHHPALWPPNTYSVVLFAAAAVLLWARRKTRLADWLLFLAFGVLSLMADRNKILLGMIGPIVIVSYLPWKRTLPVLAEFLAVVLVLIGAGAQVARGSAFQLRAAEWKFPSGAADFLLAHHVSEPMFNLYEYGGYLMWRLWPQERVFIDGRALNESVFQDYLRIAFNSGSAQLFLNRNVQQLLNQYGVQVIVVEGSEYNRGAPYLLAAALADPHQTEWKLVYRDNQAMVFMRRPPPGVEALNSLDALTAMEAQCAEHIRHSPGEPRCARGLGILFARIGDAPRARRWLAFYFERRTEPEPDLDRLYQQLLGMAR